MRQRVGGADIACPAREGSLLRGVCFTFLPVMLAVCWILAALFSTPLFLVPCV